VLDSTLKKDLISLIFEESAWNSSSPIFMSIKRVGLKI